MTIPLVAVILVSIIFFLFGFLNKQNKNHTVKISHTKQLAKLYHGTELKNALEIYNTGLWLIGDSEPSAVWMTDSIELAQIYSGKKGGIVVVAIEADTTLTKHDTSVYIYKIPDTNPQEKYYHIPGLTPVNVLDYNATKIM